MCGFMDPNSGSRLHCSDTFHTSDTANSENLVSKHHTLSLKNLLHFHILVFNHTALVFLTFGFMFMFFCPRLSVDILGVFMLHNMNVKLSEHKKSVSKSKKMLHSCISVNGNVSTHKFVPVKRGVPTPLS